MATPSADMAKQSVTAERKFGAVFAAVFAIIGLWPLFHATSPRWWALIISAGFAFLALFAPLTLRGANRQWLRLGMALHHVTNPVIMGLIYFAAILPTALIMRAVGRDPLRLKDTAKSSHWIERDASGTSGNRMTKQF